MFVFMVGLGGKGTWGKEGSEIDAEVAIRDRNDPNYDSAEEVIII